MTIIFALMQSKVTGEHTIDAVFEGTSINEIEKLSQDTKSNIERLKRSLTADFITEINKLNKLA